MPTINFKGKNAVWNHHLSVPYQILEKDNSLSVKGKNEDENLIIEADNLVALKSLLPKYQGKIKCIYIDPPYNTGNENWVYNDKSNSPLIKDWVGKTVGEDDLTRHDKWLCMMTPRLKLLKELLSGDGVIFVSIDDNEVHNLRMLMDEVFEDQNFIACIVAQLNPRGRTLDRFLAKTHEYILLYAKDSSRDTSINLLPKEGTLLNTYNKRDEKGIFRELELRNRNPVFNRANRPNLFYPIYVTPDTGDVSLRRDKYHAVEVFPRDSRGVDGCWTWGKDKVSANISILVGRRVSTSAWRIHRKDYLEDEEGNTAVTKAKALWLEKDINNEKGKEICNEVFGECPFDFPKSPELIKKCIKLGSGEDDTILDSFAGSGTTAHAVLTLNEEDGVNRKFILIQLLEEIGKSRPAYKAGFKYVHEITRERVKRVIDRDKLGDGFSYMKLGPQIDADSILAGSLPSYREFAKYVYYLATGKTMDNEKTINEKDYCVGKINGETVYLIYEKDKEKLKNLAITLDWAEKTNKKDAGKKIVYAPACFLDEEYLEKFNISFVSIPYNLFEKR